ncbi:MAG: alginate lyase family protein [Flexilinea sp.]
MSLQEVVWRIQQRFLYSKEKKSYFRKKMGICDKLFTTYLKDLSFDPLGVGINITNRRAVITAPPNIFDTYPYETNKTQWQTGFQTDNYWPLTFSYDLNYKQRDDIGDARTNWELNRHYQFSILAKNYYISRDQKWLDELSSLFIDWNCNNPFLFGISWVNPMEIAIRTLSWIMTLSFLCASDCSMNSLSLQLDIGIRNMTDYLTKHYSKFSSANNHVIIELAIIGIAGAIYQYKPWITLSKEIISKEIVRQNYSDGVNREQALHYHAFSMEAIGLFIHVLKSNNIKVPKSWLPILAKMSNFLQDCTDRRGAICEFGDSDDGVLLDLGMSRGKNEYYIYILQLMSCLLSERYDEFSRISPNIEWLFSIVEINNVKKNMLRNNSESVCYHEGGYSILRDIEGNLAVAIDHGDLGFGSIAAHGHADALSFQLFNKGKAILVDPGTFIYHIDLPERNRFRSTLCHNTVCVNGEDQSKMLGAFLWGKRATTILENVSIQEDHCIVRAFQNGYAPILHRRQFDWYKKINKLEITDELTGYCSWESSFLISPNAKIQKVSDRNIIINLENTELKMSVNEGEFSIENEWYSAFYGKREPIKAIRLHGKCFSTLSLHYIFEIW